MKRHRLVKFARITQGVVALSDVGLCALLLGFAAPDTFRASGRVTAMLLAWLAVLYGMGLYDFARFKGPSDLRRDVFVAMIVDAFLGAALFRGRLDVVAAAAVAHGVLLLLRPGWLRLFMFPWAVHNVTFLGDSPLISTLASDLCSGRHPGYRIAEWHRQVAPSGGAPTLERWAPAPGANRRSGHPASLLVIDSRLSADERSFASALTFAATTGVSTISDLEFYEVLYGKTAPSQAATAEWLLAHVLSRNQILYPALKRFFDIVAAAFGLVALSPVMAAAAILAMCDGGDPIYRQRRVGFLGKEFTILKFRTMAPGADERVPLTDRPNDDPMITRWGGVLRRFHLDELPQLWNILKGDMSLIGPRPERPEAIGILVRSVPAYHLRHLIRPGLTGWAQVNFRATNLPDGALEKLRYDLYYLKHLSPQLDLGILLRTVRRLLEPEESFSPEPAGSVPVEIEHIDWGQV